MIAIILAKLGQRRGTRREPPPRAFRLRSKQGFWLSLVPIAITGCESLPMQKQVAQEAAASSPKTDPPTASITVPTNQSPRTAQAPVGADPNGSRPGFHSKITKEQKYNVHLELGRFQETQENFEVALSEYEKALEACETRTRLHGGSRNEPQQALAHRRIGSVLDRLGRFDQSEIHYQTALKLSPDDPKVWNDAGYSYYLQGRWADSERALKTADSLDPNNSRVLTNLGLTLAASGRTDEALAAFTKAGGSAVGHANLAYILAAMGKKDEAVQHYHAALEAQPELGAARLALEALEKQSGEGPQTLVAAASAPVAPPMNPPVTLTTEPPAAPVAGPVVMPATVAPVASTPVNPPPAAPRLASQPATIPPPRPIGLPQPSQPAPTPAPPLATTVPVPTDPGLNRTSIATPAFEACHIPPPRAPQLRK